MTHELLIRARIRDSFAGEFLMIMAFYQIPCRRRPRFSGCPSDDYGHVPLKTVANQ